MLDLIKDRETLSAILSDVAGEGVAEANKATTNKVKRGIIRDCLTGSNGRTKVECWVPRRLAFPPAAYTSRGGVATFDRAARVAAQSAEPEQEVVPEIEDEPALDELADAA